MELAGSPVGCEDFKDEDGERFLEFESRGDLEESRRTLIKAYYELNRNHMHPVRPK